MANNTPASLDKWRDYFSSANSDIFNIIEHAIVVAASDCPYDFKLKRDRIAETLFSCKLTKSCGCHGSELVVASDDGVKKIDTGVQAGGSKDTKESKANNEEDYRSEIIEMNVNQINKYSYADAEDLTNEIDHESEIYEEVLRIKEIIDNNAEEPEALLFESLRLLQLMALSVETLQATEIGKSVVSLRKHGSKEIRNLTKTLIEDWKRMVDAWVDATQAIAAKVETQSVEEEEEGEEEGLPSPPLDEGAFFATPVSMELSQFFDGVDDYDGEFNKNRPPPKKNETILKKQPNRPTNGVSGLGRGKSLNNVSGPARSKPTLQPKVINNEIKVQQKSENKSTIQRKPMTSQKEKLSNIEASDQMRLETAKRKLHERYQEAENAKKQRKVQVVELSDLPKQSFVQRNNNQHTRRLPNGRR